MPSPCDIQNKIIKRFREMGDAFDEYALLIRMSAALAPYPENLKDTSHMVRGCQSDVWLDLKIADGKLRISADSNTLIIRGILQILTEMFDGQPPEDVASCRITFLSETSISETFDSARKRGIGLVISKIQSYAAATGN